MSEPVLITGGAGFIGTHLCETLTAQGHSVRVLDLKAPSRRISGVEYVQGDVRDPLTVQKCLRDVSAVYHFAAVVSVPICQETPLESTQINLMGTSVVAEAVRAEMQRRKRDVRLIFASSAAVYGNQGQKGMPLDPRRVGTDLRSFYAAQKFGSEMVLQQYRDHYRVPCVVFRFFNVFGPGQDPSSPYSGVITVFGKRIAEGRDLDLHGGGDQTRDFIFVKDLVEACASVMKLDFARCDAQPINLGSGKEITVSALAETMMRVGGKKTKINSTPARSGDVKYSCADIITARELLGWSPSTNLEDGLRRLGLN